MKSLYKLEGILKIFRPPGPYDFLENSAKSFVPVLFPGKSVLGVETWYWYANLSSLQESLPVSAKKWPDIGAKVSSGGSGFASWQHLRTCTPPTTRQAFSSEILDLTLECTKCRRVLPASEYHKDRSRANGLKPHCKECVRLYMRELRQRRKRANANRTHPSDANFRCRNCKRVLLAVDFSKNPMWPNGLQDWCKRCMNKKAKNLRKRYMSENEAKTVPEVFVEPEDGELEEAMALTTTSEVNEALSKFGMKWCPTCRQAKVYEDYYRNKYNKWGYQTYCKKCKGKQKIRDHA